MKDMSDRHFAFCLLFIVCIIGYVIVNVNWNPIDVNADSENNFNPMTHTETSVEFDSNKQVICWQGEAYHSYFNNEIGLFMLDQIREFYGVQQLIVNQTGLCQDDIKEGLQKFGDVIRQ